MDNEKKYTIELNERQLRLLNQATEFMSRFCCGQVGTTYWPHQALHGKAQKDWSSDQWCDRRDEIDGLMDRVKLRGWGLSGGTQYGVGYSPDTDILWDMYQVIRYQLYQDNNDPDKPKYTVNAYPAMKFGPEALIKITKREEDV